METAVNEIRLDSPQAVNHCVVTVLEGNCLISSSAVSSRHCCADDDKRLSHQVIVDVNYDCVSDAVTAHGSQYDRHSVI